MKVFPKGFTVRGRGRFHCASVGFPCDRIADLGGQVGRRPGEVETDIDGQHVLRPNAWEQPRPEQRRLAEAGEAEEHAQPLPSHQPNEGLALEASAPKERRIDLSEGQQSRPGVLGV
jgi:hypothetical protein